jgi:chloramphenicol-sensitive protein RarD
VDDSKTLREGFLAAAAAYGLWGLLPAFFVALDPSGPVEILGWRIALSLVFCLGILFFLKRVKLTLGLMKNRMIRGLSALAALLIFVNWGVYVFASLNEFIVEAALGYFINPLVTVALGVVVLREKLRPLQWASLSLAVVAVVVLAVGYGSVPIISLTLALSFGFYGFVKNRMGPRVKAVDSLTLETLWLSPVAAGLLVWVAVTGGLSLGTLGVGHTLLLLSAGAVTSVPLSVLRRCRQATSAVDYGPDAIHRTDHAICLWGLHHGRTDASGAVDWVRSCVGGVGSFER